jgi:carboxypeptidase Taq
MEKPMASESKPGQKGRETMKDHRQLVILFLLVALLCTGACSSPNTAVTPATTSVMTPSLSASASPTVFSLTPQQAYQELVDLYRPATYLESAMALADWDSGKVMPAKAGTWRSETRAALAAMANQIRTNPRIGELLYRLAPISALSAEQAANLGWWNWDYQRRTRLPVDFASQESELIYNAVGAWQQARSADSFLSFQPALQALVSHFQEKARILGESGGHPYDVLLADYIPGWTVARLDSLVAQLKPILLALVRDAAQKTGPTLMELVRGGSYPPDAQKALIRQMMTTLGFDSEAGLLWEGVHGMTETIGAHDVRISLPYDPANPFPALLAAIHEIGHGLYEQNLPSPYGLPATFAAGLEIHESQSRYYENHLGRTAGFWQFWLPKLQQAFGGKPEASVDQLVDALHQVQPSFIRTQADEVTYPLHVILRYEIERDLFAGTLQVQDIPRIWAGKMKEYLGLVVPDDNAGALQDIHWAMGMFGYFPSYLLGSMVAAQLDAAMRKNLPKLDSQIEAGDFSAPRQWLQEKIWSKGSLWVPDTLVAKATGSEPDPADYIRHLQSLVSPTP